MGLEVPQSEKHLQAALGFFSKAHSAQANGKIDSSRGSYTDGFYELAVAKNLDDESSWMSNKAPRSDWKSLIFKFMGEADGILHEDEVQRVLDQGREAASMISVF